MNTEMNPNHDRLYELLAGQALGDLSVHEQRELELLLEAAPNVDRESFDRVAATVELSFLGDIEPMPDDLRSRIAEAAPEHLPSERSQASRDTTGAAALPDVRPASHDGGWNAREGIAWLTALVGLAVAAFLWFGQQPVDPKPTPDAERTAAERRELLLASADDVIQVAWQPGKTPPEGGVTGDVVWSTSRQEGYLRFQGLPVNDPSQEQYQLWIIDPERDEEPIDGGVFDVTSAGEVIIPIRNKLKVIDPAAFAVTVEQPGGVVVSDQERLPVLAPVKL